MSEEINLSKAFLSSIMHILDSRIKIVFNPLKVISIFGTIPLAATAVCLLLDRVKLQDHIAISIINDNPT